MATFYTGTWTGKSGSESRKFRGYVTYTWTPYYTNELSRLTITAVGINKATSGSTDWSGGTAKASVACSGKTTISGSRALSSSPYKWGSDNLKLVSSTTNWDFIRGHTDATISITVSASKSGGTAWTGSCSGSTSFVVPARPSYAITYSADGGSPTPATQTKWYAETLTLSGAISKTGYTFYRWQATNGSYYTASGAYYANEATKLTARWTPNSYTILYNSNNGSGSMANTSATYDSDVTLRTNTFTRAGYNFKGWSTSATATTPTYTDGQTTRNIVPSGTVTLYAVWELVYVDPDITVLGAKRVDSSGDDDDTGESAMVQAQFNFAKEVDSSGNANCVQTAYQIEYKLSTASTWTQMPVQTATPSGSQTDYTVNYKFPNSVVFNTDLQYDIRINVWNPHFTSSVKTRSTFISKAEFDIDIVDDFIKTKDTAIDPLKTYYTRSGSYEPYTYTKVTSPSASALGTYYEVWRAIGIFTTAPESDQTVGIAGDIELIIDETATSGIDHDLYTALHSLGWV